MDYFPRRIICMTEETTETLYLIGEQERIVGISGYTVRPEQARQEKPRISAFTHANIPKILKLKPDLVLGFSDMQADIAAELVKHGINVHIFNQRSVNGIFSMINLLGNMVGASEKTCKLIVQLQQQLDEIKNRAAVVSVKPRVYFEEWNDPLITGIGWVSELIELAGGEDCFAENSRHAAARDRVLADPDEVIRRNPDIIIGSWCGKRFRAEQLKVRAGWQNINAVRNNHVYEIKSSYILQPGPAALTEGVRQISELIQKWRQSQ